MATSLTGVGVFWAALSLISTFIICVGYYIPFWIQGRLLGKVDAYFGSFRRCNYPKISNLGVVEIVEQCGRYTKFSDIPSIWWQATTILVGLGCALSLLVAVMATAALCITYVIQGNTSRIAGFMQLTASLLIALGGALYPLGWNNREVQEACGSVSDMYDLGTCQLSWSVYMLGTGTALLFLCFTLSFCASRYKSSSFRI